MTSIKCDNGDPRRRTYVEMKTTLPLLVALIAGLMAGCGSSTTLGSVTVTAPTTTTIAHVKTDASIRCKVKGTAVGAKAPSPGHQVTASSDGRSPTTLQLSRRHDGSLIVSCTS